MKSLLSLESGFRHFMVSLKDAASRMQEHYLQIPVADVEDMFYRERVYCYELYHQLRSILGEKFPYKLCGESRESEHSATVSGKMPDFVVHRPGSEDHNLAVMEIKPETADKKNLKKSIKTIDDYLRGKSGYFQGILIIYGNGGGGKKNSPESIETARRLVKRFNEKILLMWHRGPGEKPVVVNSTEW